MTRTTRLRLCAASITAIMGITTPTLTAAPDPILKISDSLIDAYPTIRTTAQGVLPLPEERAVGVDGSLRKAPPFPLAISGNPWESSSRVLAGVDLVTGSACLTETDLYLPAYMPWPIIRSYSSRDGATDGSGPLGEGWHLCTQMEVSKSSGHLTIVFGPDAFLEFEQVPSTTVFRGINGTAGAVEILAGAPGEPGTITYFDQVGNAAVFFDSSFESGDAAGQLWKVLDSSGEPGDPGASPPVPATPAKTAYVGHETDPVAAIANGFVAGTGLVAQAFDSAGRQFDYSYVGSSLRSIEVSDGGAVVARVDYGYDGTRLAHTKVRTVTAQPAILQADGDLVVHTAYRYDAEGRMSLFVDAEGARSFAAAGPTDRLAYETYDFSTLPSDPTLLHTHAMYRFEYASTLPESSVSSVYLDGLQSHRLDFAFDENAVHPDLDPQQSGTGYVPDWFSRAVVNEPYGSSVFYFDEAGQGLSRVHSDTDPSLSPPARLWAIDVVRTAEGVIDHVSSAANNVSYAHGTGVFTQHDTEGLVTWYEYDSDPVSATYMLPIGMKHSAGVGSMATKIWDIENTLDVTGQQDVGTYLIARPWKLSTREYVNEVADTATPTSDDFNFWEFNVSYYVKGTSPSLAVHTVEVVEPTVTTDRNGSGLPTAIHYQYQRDGRLELRKSQSGRIDGFQYDTLTGLRTQSGNDIDSTGQSPLAEFVSTPGAYERIWSVEYDAVGRPIRTTRPDGVTSEVFRSSMADGRLLVAGVPLVDTGRYAGPVGVMLLDHAGNAAESADVPLAEFATEMPGALGRFGWTAAAPATWFDLDASALPDAFTLRPDSEIRMYLRGVYDSTGSRLATLDSYYEIPTGFDRAEFDYDDAARLTEFVDPTMTIEQYGYDELDRRVTRSMGVGSDIRLVNQWEYDHGQAGDNSLLTKETFDPWDPRGIQPVAETRYGYDYRGYLRTVAPPHEPYVLSDVDNLGRITAAALYGGASTVDPFGQGADRYVDASLSVFMSETFASGVGRRALDEVRYDQRGYVYCAVNYWVHQTNGTLRPFNAVGITNGPRDLVVDAVTSERWRDGEGHVVGEQNADGGAIKRVYDRVCRESTVYVIGSLDTDDSGDVTYAEAASPTTVVDANILSEIDTYRYEDRDEPIMVASWDRWPSKAEFGGAEYGDGAPGSLAPAGLFNVEKLGKWSAAETDISSIHLQTTFVPPSGTGGLMDLQTFHYDEMGRPVRQANFGNNDFRLGVLPAAPGHPDGDVFGRPHLDSGTGVPTNEHEGVPMRFEAYTPKPSDVYSLTPPPAGPTIYLQEYSPQGPLELTTGPGDNSTKMEYDGLNRPVRQDIYEPPRDSDLTAPDPGCNEVNKWSYCAGRQCEFSTTDDSGLLPEQLTTGLYRDMICLGADCGTLVPLGPNGQDIPLDQATFPSNRDLLMEVPADHHPTGLNGLPERIMPQPDMGMPPVSPDDVTWFGNNAAGAPSIIRDQGQNVTTFDRDGMGRDVGMAYFPAPEFDGRVTGRSIGFDDLGRPNYAETLGVGGASLGSVGYEYDGWGRLESMTQEPIPGQTFTTRHENRHVNVPGGYSGIYHQETTYPTTEPVSGDGFTVSRDHGNLWDPMVTDYNLDASIGRPTGLSVSIGVGNTPLPVAETSYFGIANPAGHSLPDPGYANPLMCPGGFDPFIVGEDGSGNPIFEPNDGIDALGRPSESVWFRDNDTEMSGLEDQPAYKMSTQYDVNGMPRLMRDHQNENFSRGIDYGCELEQEISRRGFSLWWWTDEVNGTTVSVERGPGGPSGNGESDPGSNPIAICAAPGAECVFWGTEENGGLHCTIEEHDTTTPSTEDRLSSRRGMETMRNAIMERVRMEPLDEAGQPQEGNGDLCIYLPEYHGDGSLKTLDGPRSFATEQTGFAALDDVLEYSYDSDGRLTSIERFPVLRDVDGTPICGADGTVDLGSPVSFAEYGYDVLGRLSWARRDLDLDGSLGDEYREFYVYDHMWRRVETHREEDDGTGTGTLSVWLTERYVYRVGGKSGRGGWSAVNLDAPIMRYTYADPSDTTGTIIWYLQNHRGDVIATLDDAGVPIEWVRYGDFGEPFLVRTSDFNLDGEVTIQDLLQFLAAWYAQSAEADFNLDGAYAAGSNGEIVDLLEFQADFYAALSTGPEATLRGDGHLSRVGSTFGFAGYWWDDHAKVYHVRHRVYDPYLGEWLQRDPLGYVDGDNLYAYLNGSFFHGIDPFGLFKSTDEIRGRRRGERGTFYHTYERGWFGLRHEHVGTIFVPDAGFADNFDPEGGIDALNNRCAKFRATTGRVAGHVQDGMNLALEVGEIAVRTAAEPVDLVMTAGEVIADPTNPYAYAGFLPLFPGSVSKVAVRLPRTRGRWEGTPGDGLWFSDKPAVTNVTGGKPVVFRNGRPDFSPWEFGHLKFKPGQLDGSAKDFDKVYERIADTYKLKNKTAGRNWLKERGLTPHHASATKIELVPTALHGNVPHAGAASDLRRGCDCSSN